MARRKLTGYQDLTIGIEGLCPGLDAQLLGLKQRESKTFRLFIPNDLPSELPSTARLTGLAGKQVVFRVKILVIKEKKFAPIDDAYATGRGYESLAGFKAAVKASLEEQGERVRQEGFKRQVADQLLVPYSFSPPLQLVQRWLGFLTNSFVQEQGLGGQAREVIQEALSKASKELAAQAIFCVSWYTQVGTSTTFLRSRRDARALLPRTRFCEKVLLTSSALALVFKSTVPWPCKKKKTRK